MSNFSFAWTHKQESTLHRESLGVSRVNHILRVHGHTVLEEGQAAQALPSIFGKKLRWTHRGELGASVAERNPVRWCKRAVDAARPAHLGALAASKPRIVDKAGRSCRPALT